MHLCVCILFVGTVALHFPSLVCMYTIIYIQRSILRYLCDECKTVQRVFIPQADYFMYFTDSTICPQSLRKYSTHNRTGLLNVEKLDLFGDPGAFQYLTLCGGLTWLVMCLS